MRHTVYSLEELLSYWVVYGLVKYWWTSVPLALCKGTYNTTKIFIIAYQYLEFPVVFHPTYSWGPCVFNSGNAATSQNVHWALEWKHVAYSILYDMLWFLDFLKKLLPIGSHDLRAINYCWSCWLGSYYSYGWLGWTRSWRCQFVFWWHQDLASLHSFCSVECHHRRRNGGRSQFLKQLPQMVPSTLGETGGGIMMSHSVTVSGAGSVSILLALSPFSNPISLVMLILPSFPPCVL